MGKPMRATGDMPPLAGRAAPELVAVRSPVDDATTDKTILERAEPARRAVAAETSRLAWAAREIWRRGMRVLRDPASYRLDLSLDDAGQAFGILWRRMALPVLGGWLIAALAIAVLTSSLHAIGDRKVEIAQLLTAMPPTVTLKEEPLKEDDLTRIAAAVRASHPGVEVRQKDGVVILRAPGMAMYGSWLAAIETVFNAIPYGDWSIEELCIGEGCENPGQPMAMLKGRRRQLIVSDLLAR